MAFMVDIAKTTPVRTIIRVEMMGIANWSHPVQGARILKAWESLLYINMDSIDNNETRGN